MVSQEKMTVTELAVAVESHLVNRGFSKIYRKSLGFILQDVVNYCLEKGETIYYNELGQQFIERRIETSKKLGESRLSLIKRAVQMLSDYQQFGTVTIRRRSTRSFPEQFAEGCNGYINELRRNNRSENTVKSQTHSLYNLTEFLDGIGVESFESLTLAHMNEYIKSSLCNYCQSSAATRLRDARNLLTHLYKQKIVTDDIASKLMKCSAGTIPVFLPLAFKQEDVKKMLAAVDRKSPTGKRAYAVILLVAKSGLRMSDMQTLKFENIDWDNNAIRLPQFKTKEALVIPLSTDVGWALIEYITHARPISDLPNIFLQERAPYDPLINFDNILVKYMRIAEVTAEYLRHHGLHALRHSLGTTLLEQDVPLDVIQSILGHVNMETTQKYTAVNVKQLRECALEVPVL